MVGVGATYPDLSGAFVLRASDPRTTSYAQAAASAPSAGPDEIDSELLPLVLDLCRRTGARRTRRGLGIRGGTGAGSPEDEGARKVG